jgi:nickel/cobalt transporter (NicO) family protein
MQAKAVIDKRTLQLFCLALLALGAGCFALSHPAFAQTALPGNSPFGVPGAARIATPEADGITAWLLTKQAEFHRAMTGAMQAIRDGRANILPLLGLAFGYGIIHAIGPGHGKAVIASYLVANEGTMRRGIALAFGAALVQALIALALVALVAGLLGGTARMMEDVTLWVERIGFAIILAMGIWILWRKGRALFFPHRHTHGDACDECGHHHGGDVTQLAASSPRDLIITAIGAGARPCAGAIILLVFALTQGLFAIGAASVAVMAIGTAMGTSLFALLAVKSKQLALRIAGGRSGTGRVVLLGLEALAGLALALLGLALLTGTMTAGA